MQPTHRSECLCILFPSLLHFSSRQHVVRRGKCRGCPTTSLFTPEAPVQQHRRPRRTALPRPMRGLPAAAPAQPARPAQPVLAFARPRHSSSLTVVVPRHYRASLWARLALRREVSFIYHSGLPLCVTSSPRCRVHVMHHNQRAIRLCCSCTSSPPILHVSRALLCVYRVFHSHDVRASCSCFIVCVSRDSHALIKLVRQIIHIK
jgi:hypothetical protein